MKKEVSSFLAQKCQEEANEFRSWILWKLDEGKIESPIEQLFFIAWEALTPLTIGKYELVPQFKITKKGELFYRLDFAVFQTYDTELYYITILDEFGNQGKNLKMAIELDSFTFHDRDNRQFEYEKKRDRYLHSNGWKVFRFSGSEIMRNPTSCVEEIYDQLFELENEDIDRKFGDSIKDKE